MQHIDDQKYGFMREWILNFPKQTKFALHDYFEKGTDAWKLLQQMPEHKEDDAWAHLPDM